MSERISSYSSPLALGHKGGEEFFDGHTYVVQEKIDGSQFSFGIREVDPNDEHAGYMPVCRSRNTQLDMNAGGMFGKAIETVNRLFQEGKLTPGYTYRGEYVSKPKHNVLTYKTTPPGCIILFDIDRGLQDYLNPIELELEAEYLGLMCVPLIAASEIPPTAADLAAWLDRESCLGGVKIEGVVLKNYHVWGPDKKTLMLKYVSSDFKEVHNSDWKARHPNRADIVQQIIAEYGSEARWQKAIQHLQETGQLTGTPADIGTILKEIAQDFDKECKADVANIFYNHFRKDLMRGIQQGFPDWYKNRLASATLEG